MARDEALLTAVGAGESPPTLRLYQWDPPTISLGYFQRFADYEALDPPAGELPVVRRLTGGGAILHDLELTYSLTLPLSHRLLDRGPHRLYEIAHGAIAAALRPLGVKAAPCGFTDDSTPRRGPFFCFERRHEYDLLIGRAKVAGSAQRRTRTAILQHGSIILGNRYGQQQTATLPVPFAESVAGLRTTVAVQLARACGLGLEDSDWSQAELTAIAPRMEKYRGTDWARRI